MLVPALLKAEGERDEIFKLCAVVDFDKTTCDGSSQGVIRGASTMVAVSLA